MQRLEEIEKLLFECEKDAKRLTKIKKELKKIEQNRKKLASYYDEDYMKDFDNAKNFSRDYAMLDEDSIWNVLTDEYQRKIEIVKFLVKAI
ncbi:MAG: DUF4298 domain-containing protein [Arcobacter sp.]|nr:DUF4298 domain-containing protein [Arcobacter sp.]